MNAVFRVYLSSKTSFYGAVTGILHRKRKQLRGKLFSVSPLNWSDRLSMASRYVIGLYVALQPFAGPSNYGVPLHVAPFVGRARRMAYG